MIIEKHRNVNYLYCFSCNVELQGGKGLQLFKNIVYDLTCDDHAPNL